MKQKRCLTLAVLLFLSLWSFAQVSTVQFTENTGDITNPERGFYKHTTTHEATMGALTGQEPYIPLTQAQLTGYRNNGNTLILRLFYIREFAGSDHISQAYLNKMTADFQALRANGMKAFIRFAYSNSANSKDNGITLARIQNHLADVKPILEANKDVIMAVQAGFVGAWGEWYYTNNFGDQGQINNQQWIKRYDVITALLQNVPSSIMVQLRSPAYKTRYLQYIGESSSALNESEAYNPALAKARLGHHNDCFLSTPDNLFKTIKIPKSQLINLAGSITVGYRVFPDTVAPLNQRQLPVPSQPMVSYTMGTNAVTNGVVNWDNTSNLVFPFGFMLALKVADDANNVYIYVGESGYTNASTYELYLNTDNNNTTGWIENTGKWTSSGAEMLVKDGVLNTYTNNTWTPITATGMTITPSTTDAIDDVGTFLNTGEIAYQATDSRFVAVGGESCIPNNQNQCTKSLARMAAHHYTYMNTDYRGEVVQRWQDQGCYPEMGRRLGYRFRLTESRIQSSVNAGKALSVSIDVNNNGFAAPFNKRSLELILTNTVTSQEFKIDLENNSSDVRFWLSGNHTINESVTIPTNIPVGSYTLALNLPDASLSLHTDPRYSIQFANQGIWNATKGYNNLNTTINVLAQTGAGTTTIVVDGNATDWQNVDNLSLGSGNVQTLKSYDDANNLYFIAQGTLGNGYTVFIDADGKSFTGYVGAAQGADYKIENGNIFRHEFGESWIQITATPQVVHNGTVTEVSVPKTALYGLGETVKFSYNDLQTSVIQNTLPVSGLQAYTLNFPLSVPRPAINIVTDGNSADWLYLDAASSNGGDLKILKIFDDATNIHLLVKGAIGTVSQIFFNTDNNATTGLVDNTIWPGMGADYVILNNNLYKHDPTTAAGTNAWAWTLVGAITSQIATDNGTHEIAIAKALFTNPSLSANAAINVGYRKLVNNVEVAKVPAVGGMAPYILGGGSSSTAPSSPTNMSATTISSSQINLSWTDNASNEDGFDIQRSLTGTNAWQLITTVGANTTSFSNTNIASGVQYFYRVRASNTIGISNWSNAASATTPGTVPNAPSNLVATAFSSSQIDLSWIDNATNESNFEIQQSPTGTANWTALTTVAENSTSYSNSGLTPNTTYYYRIRTTNAIGNSSYTTAASATTPTGGGGGGSILVDGNSADWNGISAVATASGQSMTTMRITDSGTHLFILIEGAALGPNTQLFINSDNDTATGYQSATWSNSGMDYLLENGTLLKSTANTNVWSWQAQTNAVVQYVKNASVIEISLLKTDINPNTLITVGVIDYNGATPWALVSKLPATGGMAVYTLTGANASSIPPAPSGLAASAASTSQISLTWADNAANESNFEIQQSPTGTNNWATIVTVPANSTSHTITDLAATTTYHYRVRAINANGASTYTNAVSATTQTAGGGASILVDGNSADWSGINAVTTASGQSMTSMRVTDSGTHLYILVEGAALGPNTQLFLNTDNNTATGYQSVTWTNSGMDYLLENGTLLKSTANTNVWSWQAQTNAVVQYNKNASTIEIGLLKTDINPSATITVGVIDYDGATPWSLVSKLPAVGGMAVYALTGTNGITIPNAPTALAATAVSTSQIDVTWTDNALNEINYELQQSPTGTGNWSTIATLNANSTSYANTGLTPNTTYYYRVRATNTAGASAYTNSASATTQNTIPTIVVDGNASDWSGVPTIATETGQTITSMKVTDNATYLYILLEGANISTHTEVFINTDNNDSTGHQHEDWITSGADFMIEDGEQSTALSDDANWDWQFDGTTGVAYAKNASVVEISILKSNISPSTTITIGAEDLNGGWNMVSTIPSGNAFISYTLGGGGNNTTIPNAPTALTASSVSTSQIDITWTDNATDEDTFEIQQAPSGTGNWSTLSTVSANITSYSNTGLTENTTYDYRVRATNTAGSSNWSAITSATTAQATPNAPTALTAIATSVSQIDVTWTDNATNEDTFEIQQALSGTGNWSTLATVNINITSYSNTGLTANTTYDYRVRATNTAGSSSWSAITSATTQSNSGSGPTITVDGNASDWSTISTIATETGQNITSMKVTDSPTHLYILLEGSGISTHTEIFINTDDDDSTGHQHEDWTTSGADFMIEDGEQYTATSDDSNWDWQFDGDSGIVYAKNASVVEISILKTNISPNATITIGAEDLDSGWNMVSTIPSGNAFVSYTLTNTAKVGAKPYITGNDVLYPNPNQGNFDIKYGNDDVQSVTIYNMLGAKIFEKEYTDSPKTDHFNLSTLKIGLYKVLITTNHTSIMKTLFISD